MTPRTTSPPTFMPKLLRAALLVGAIAMVLALPVSASAATFDPLNIFSDETLRAANSMSRADIQAFLEAQTGVLKSYSAAEGGPNGAHSTVAKPASQIIYEASQYWNVNPKLVLATLQKEQSLLAAKAPSAYTLGRAMGCGVYPSSPDLHPGFGDQVWTGTQKLGQTTGPYAWKPGQATDNVHEDTGLHDAAGNPIYRDKVIVPANQPTWNLYTYTPYYPQVGIWNIYLKYFGDPQAPPRLRPMYRFYNKTTGAYFFTTSEAERWRVIARKQSYIKFQGPVFTLDTSSTANVVPLYRLYNKIGQRYFYTASASEKAAALKLKSRGRAIYRVDAVAGNVSLTTGTPVYRLYCRKTNTYIWTTSEAEKAALIRSKQWKYNGIVFSLGQYTPPVG
jgi:hypothetical protein